MLGVRLRYEVKPSNGDEGAQEKQGKANQVFSKPG